MDLNRRWQFSIDNASVTELHVDGTRYVVKRINETAHIRDLLKPHSGSLYISTEEKQKLRRS
jgi:broad specificity phosphatase PhoE